MRCASLKRRQEALGSSRTRDKIIQQFVIITVRLVRVVVGPAVERSVALELPRNAQRTVGAAKVRAVVAIGADRVLHFRPDRPEAASARHLVRRGEPVFIELFIINFRQQTCLLAISTVLHLNRRKF